MKKIEIDLSWVAFWVFIALWTYWDYQDDAQKRQTASYEECVRTAQTIALAGGHLDCKAP